MDNTQQEWRVLQARCQVMGLRDNLIRAHVYRVGTTWILDGYEECEWARIQQGAKRRPATEIQPYPVGPTTM